MEREGVFPLQLRDERGYRYQVEELTDRLRATVFCRGTPLYREVPLQLTERGDLLEKLLSYQYAPTRIALEKIGTAYRVAVGSRGLLGGGGCCSSLTEKMNSWITEYEVPVPTLGKMEPRCIAHCYKGLDIADNGFKYGLAPLLYGLAVYNLLAQGGALSDSQLQFSIMAFLMARDTYDGVADATLESYLSPNTLIGRAVHHWIARGNFKAEEHRCAVNSKILAAMAWQLANFLLGVYAIYQSFVALEDQDEFYDQFATVITALLASIPAVKDLSEFLLGAYALSPWATDDHWRGGISQEEDLQDMLLSALLSWTDEEEREGVQEWIQERLAAAYGEDEESITREREKLFALLDARNLTSKERETQFELLCQCFRTYATLQAKREKEEQWGQLNR